MQTSIAQRLPIHMLVNLAPTYSLDALLKPDLWLQEVEALRDTLADFERRLSQAEAMRIRAEAAKVSAEAGAAAASEHAAAAEAALAAECAIQKEAAVRAEEADRRAAACLAGATFLDRAWFLSHCRLSLCRPKDFCCEMPIDEAIFLPCNSSPCNAACLLNVLELALQRTDNIKVAVGNCQSLFCGVL